MRLILLWQINDIYIDCIKQARTYYPGVGSDHNPAGMKMDMRLKKQKKPTFKEQLNINMLKQHAYRPPLNVEVKNTYEMLHVEENGQNEEDS